MHLDFAQTEPKDRYKVLTALVVPRPIAWVSSISPEGITNLAPFSFFSVMGSRPPIVAFAPGNKSPNIPKDTARNILETREYVINLVDETTASHMVESAKPHDADISEIDLTHLTAIPSLAVCAPRIAEAPVSMECKHLQEIKIGENRMVIGEILHLHIKDGILDPETLHLNPEANYAPLGRMASPDNYCRTIDQFRL